MFEPKTIELSSEERRSIAVGILTDAVMFDRTYYAISTLNCVSGKAEGDTQWEPIDQAANYTSVFHLMGVSFRREDEDMANELARIYRSFEAETDLHFTKPAEVVAEQIYVEMMQAIKTHNRKTFFKNAKK